MDTKAIIEKVARLHAEKQFHVTEIENQRRDLFELEAKLRECEDAKAIVRLVALQTQQQLQFELSDCVTNAQSDVFPDQHYAFDVEFVEKRGTTECVLSFVRDGGKIDPLAASGYGPVDIAAFALRAVCWAMSKKTRPVFVLDEPFKHLKGEDANRRAIKLMSMLSKELGIQIITVSDERAPREDIAKGADKLFLVENKAGKSKVKEVQE